MSNYEYANSTGLTALSERTFEKIKSKITTDVVTSEAANPLVIETDAAQYAKKTHLTLEPVQDLHGYDHPWAGGSGKNKCYSSNFNGTVGNVTFVTNADGTVTCNGTASQDIIQIIGSFELLAGVSYKGNGCPSGGGSTTFSLFFDYIGNDTGTGTIEYTRDTSVNGSAKISIKSGYTCNNLTFKPMVRFSSVSDATFEPYSNVCPITGVDEVEVRATGKNLFDKDSIHSLHSTVSNTRYGFEINAVGTYTIKANKVPSEPMTIYCKKVSSGVYGTAQLVVSGTALSNSIMITLNTDEKLIVFNANEDSLDTSKNKFSQIDLQIELGSTATTYEPYQGYTASLDLPEPVYSGTLDLETGELVVDMASVDLGTLNWIASETVTPNANRFQANITNIKESNSANKHSICSEYTLLVLGGTYSATTDGYTITSTAAWFYVDAYKASTASAFTSAMSGVQLCYELKTPITYQLTPQQLALCKGINNISTNVKTVQVTYRNGELATLEELNTISFDLSNVKSKLPPIIIKDGMLQVTYDDGQ